MSDLASTQPAIRAVALPEDAADPRVAPTARPAAMRPPPLADESAVSTTEATQPPPRSSGRSRVARSAGAIEESVRLVRKDPRREDD